MQRSRPFEHRHTATAASTPGPRRAVFNTTWARGTPSSNGRLDARIGAGAYGLGRGSLSLLAPRVRGALLAQVRGEISSARTFTPPVRDLAVQGWGRVEWSSGSVRLVFLFLLIERCSDWLQ